MAAVPQKTDWQNRYDNADLVQENEARDIAASFAAFDQMRAEHAYYDTLLKRHELLSKEEIKVPTLKRDGTWEYKLVDTTLLVGPPSEFEGTRNLILRKLNDQAKTKPEDRKRLFAQFECDGVWELSSKMANYMIDKRRKDQVYTDYNPFT